MRLGEIRNILWQVISEDENKMIIEHEPIFGGQAQIVKNYGLLIPALDMLSEQSWNQLDYSPIKAIKEEYGEDKSTAQLTQEKFNQLNSYISSLNSKLPFYVSILETMVDDQDEKVINIKLPSEVNSLADLEKINKDLQTLFKKFNLAGEFKFLGFDKGSSWYEILITAETLYRYFISCLDTALAVLNLKKTYCESEQAKLNYRASLRDGEKYDEKEQTKHNEKYMDVYLEDKIEKIIKNVNETNGKTPQELHTNLIMATKELVKQLGEGVEFHLSLNPPEYVEEGISSLKIDYKNMPAIKAPTDKKPKQVEAPREKETEK
jgi:hypothetical protein